MQQYHTNHRAILGPVAAGRCLLNSRHLLATIPVKNNTGKTHPAPIPMVGTVFETA
ncbi:MAG: hypothetical protein U0975_14820 [Erythrobacter sp.]|nr:hypothetical protein [Erythrobacter sp.]MDZ4273931.1 hypothetical protein [Erythrobacter sp.]